MDPGSVQITEAVALIVISGVYLWNLSTRKALEGPPAPYAPAAEFRTAIQALPDDCEAAGTFAQSAADLFKTYRESSAGLDAKIGTVLGFVAGGSGVFAILSGTDKIARPVLSPLIIVAALALVAVFLCAFEGLRPQLRNSPNVAELADPKLMVAANGKSRMNALMGWESLEAARQIVPIVQHKVRWLQRSYAAFAIGVLALVLNAISPIPAPSSGTTTTTTTYRVPTACTIATKANDFKCTITATETKK